MTPGSYPHPHPHLHPHPYPHALALACPSVSRSSFVWIIKTIYYLCRCVANSGLHYSELLSQDFHVKDFRSSFWIWPDLTWTYIWSLLNNPQGSLHFTPVCSDLELSCYKTFTSRIQAYCLLLFRPSRRKSIKPMAMVSWPKCEGPGFNTLWNQWTFNPLSQCDLRVKCNQKREDILSLWGRGKCNCILLV